MKLKPSFRDWSRAAAAEAFDTLLVRMWSIFALVHQLSVLHVWLKTDWRLLLGGSVCLLAAGNLWRQPGRLRLLTFLACWTLALVVQPPQDAMHVLVAIGANVMFFAAALRQPPGAWSLNGTVLPIRIVLAGMYYWAAIHKLNADFVDASTTCATYFVNPMFVHYLGFAPFERDSSLTAVLAWAVIVLEFVIPTALLVSRWRRLGLVLGLGFHAGLSLYPYHHIFLYSFASCAGALYLVFLDSEQVARGARVRLAPRRLSAPVTLGVVAAVIDLILFAKTSEYSRMEAFGMGKSLQIVVRGFWLIALINEARVYVAALIPRTSPALTAATTVTRGQPFAWCVAILLVIQGVAPYVGLQTHRVYSMFSNLYTESAPGNHFFLGRLPRLSDRQGDIVRILNTNDPSLRRRSGGTSRMNYHELRRVASTASGRFTVVYERNGRKYAFDKANDPDAEIFRPLPLWDAWWFRYRSVQASDRPQRCLH